MKSIPLLIIPFFVYNLFVVADVEFLSVSYYLFFSDYAMTGGSLILLLSIVLLCLDIVKSAVFGRGSALELILSIVLLLVCCIQIVIWPAVRTECYLLMLALQATDVVATLVVLLQVNGKALYVNR